MGGFAISIRAFLLTMAALLPTPIDAGPKAPAILAKAGVLRNTPATCFNDSRIIGTLKMHGVIYKTGTVVASDRVVTANGPEAAKELALRVLSLLKT
ncbi:MAG: DJ-1/PfpI family protein [Spirochaetia bacterium]|jgi:putative intracellular protease/amidase